MNPSQLLRAHVSRIAKRSGLWNERNAAQDYATLVEAPEDSGQLSAFAVNHVSQAKDTARYVREALARQKAPIQDVFFDWRHLGSLVDRLDSDEIERPLTTERIGRLWSADRHAFGLVTVVVPDSDLLLSGWRALYRELGGSQAPGLRDFRERRGVGMYDGLHTRLRVPGLRKGLGEVLVEIRFVAPSTAKEIAYPSIQPQSHKLVARFNDIRASAVRVFTPDRDPVLLPIGGTVLSFARIVHDEKLKHVLGAKSNDGRWFGLFDPLEDGGEYEIQERDIAPLPMNWQPRLVEVGLATSEIADIRLAYRRVWRRYYQEHGRAHFEALLQKHVDAPLEALLDTVCQRQIADGTLPQTVLDLDWLEAAGRLDPATLPVPEQLDRMGDVVQPLLRPMPEDVESYLDDMDLALRQFVDSLDNRLFEELQFDTRLRSRIGQIIWCPKCRGRDYSRATKLLASRQGDVVELHLPVADGSAPPCCPVGIPVLRRWRPRLGSYLVIETTNEPGVARSVLSVLEAAGLELAEVVGRRLGTNWGVFRVEIDAVPRRRLIDVEKQLNNLSQVRQVRGFSKKALPALEAQLPARRNPNRDISWRPLPYLAGAEILSDQYFYGREREFSTLLHAAETAGVAMVEGPYRYGKTSIVRRLQRHMEGAAHSAGLFVFGDYREQGWQGLCLEILSDLEKRLQQTNQGYGLQADLPLFDPSMQPSVWLAQALEHLAALPDHPRVVLAIDEAPAALDDAERCADLETAVRIQRAFESQHLGLLIWIAPRSASLTVSTNIEVLFSRSIRILLQPLTLEEAGQLMRADKLGRFHRIRVKSGAIVRAHQVTRGDPYWLARLAVCAKNIADRYTPVRPINESIMEEAEEVMLLDQLPFSARLQLAPRASGDNEVEYRILELLSKPTDRMRLGASLGMITDTLRREGAFHSEEQPDQRTARALVRLVADRALVHEGGRYGIGCELLRRFIHEAPHP